MTETPALAFGTLVEAIKGQNILSYTGSLTTPPCAEGLKFLVTTQQLPLDVASFNTLKAVVGFNSRFTQNTVGATNLLSLTSATLTAAGAEAGAAAPVAAPIAAPVAPVAEAATTDKADPIAKAPTGGVTSIQAGSASEVSDIVKELTGVDLAGII